MERLRQQKILQNNAELTKQKKAKAKEEELYTEEMYRMERLRQQQILQNNAELTKQKKAKAKANANAKLKYQQKNYYSTNALPKTTEQVQNARAYFGLSLTNNVNQRELRKKYKTKAMTVHPDKRVTNNATSAKEEFQLLSGHYETLKNIAK